MAKTKTRVTAAAVAMTSALFGTFSASVWAGPDDDRGGAENGGMTGKDTGEASRTYAELEAQIGAYRQYHAEEDLLACLREAKSDPRITGTHVVGPRLKQLTVKQALYADFRNDTPDLTPEHKRRVEREIVELHLKQRKHIEFARGLFTNGLATTNEALLEYHDTGCIGGLTGVVEEIRKTREATPHPETP